MMQRPVMVAGGAMRELWASPHVSALSAARHAQSAVSGNVWTIAAVLVAVVGSAIVAWQAWETHRTTDLGRAALAASHTLVIDGARSRLDQGAPRIDVYVEGVSVLTAGLEELPGSSIESGEPLNLEQDAARPLRVQALVRVKNLMSDRTTHLKVTGLHDPALRADTEVLLLPRTELLYFLTATFTLDQWAENWRSHQAGMPVPNVAEGCVTSGDDRDEGVVDQWPLRLAAWPIQPAEGVDGAWLLTEGAAGKGCFDIAMRPLRERSYWISQRRRIPLPDLPGGQAPAGRRRAWRGRALCAAAGSGYPLLTLPRYVTRCPRAPLPLRLPLAFPGGALAWLAGRAETRNANTTVELRYWLVA
jgi:hypothetical protein